MRRKCGIRDEGSEARERERERASGAVDRIEEVMGLKPEYKSI